LLFAFVMNTLFLLLYILLYGSLVQARTAVLSPGRSMEWKIPAGAAISVSDGAVVHVTDLGSKVKVMARKLGVATIRTAHETLSISVLPDADHRLFDTLNENLQGRRGLELSVEGKTIFIRGRLLRFDDWRALGEAADGTSSHFIFAASMTPELSTQAETYFKSRLRKAHLPELAVSFQPDAVVSMPLDPAELKARVEHVLGSYGFRLEASAAALSLEPLVRVKLVVAEFRKDKATQYGVTWPLSVHAQLVPQFRFPGETDIGVDVSALERSGIAKVLASPTLLCRSGKEAQFLAGGEFPIKIANYKTHDIIWKQYGVVLKIKPKADFSGRMSIGIETEVSTLDRSNIVDGVPGLLTNRIETHFDLSSSRTIVLSGLIKKEWGDAMQGLPGLSSIPVLGALFGSRDFQEHRSELVVFVTPEVARPDEESL
jgi:pilus assembly protein CpaC